MARTDFKKLDHYRAKVGEFRSVDVPATTYLMVDGRGDPNRTPAHGSAIETLFPMAYALKFASKQQCDRDYVVMPLEGLWWAEDLRAFTTARDKSRWHWTMMIMVAEWTTPAMFDDALDKVARKSAPAAIDRIRMEVLEEGHCLQTLHVGAYDDEGPTLEQLHDIEIPAADLAPTGKHHEIYLSDARRVEPVKLRTILRQPVAPATPAGSLRAG